MVKFRKIGAVMLLSVGLALAGTTCYAAETSSDSHTDSHSDSHADGDSGGKGKGPKYMGGDRGSSHSGSSHSGGSSHHDTSDGGSKTLEDTVFRGKKPPGAGSGEDGSHETGEAGETDPEHSH